MCTRRRRWWVLGIVSAGILCVTLVDGARAATFEAPGTAAVSGLSIENCYEEAKDAAFRAILVKAIDRFAGSYKPDRHAGIADQAGRFIRRHKVKSKKDAGNGMCSVTVAARIKEKDVKRAIAAATIGGAKIGVVLRYVVDGQLSDQRGVNPLLAERALGDELRRFNCQLVNIVHQHEMFAKRTRPIWTAIGGENAAAEYQESSFAEAVWTVLSNMRRLLQMDIGMGSAGFDRVLIGDVRVASRGRDPDGPGYIAQASASAGVYKLSDDSVTSASAAGVDALGPSQDAAWTAALRAVLHHLTRDLSAEGSVCSVD